MSYITDITYTEGVYERMSPAYLSLACAIHGYKPPNWKEEFDYLELGCGKGYTLNSFAATYPKSFFVGLDFNPAHIEEATLVKDKAGLEEILFTDCRIEDYLKRSRLEPRFNYIALHGVYSWVSEETRAAILEIVERTLLPGGVLYISYDSFPGWSTMLPFHELLKREMKTQSPLMALKNLFQRIKQLREKGGCFPKAIDPVWNRWERLEDMDWRYVLHEYGNGELRPFYFDEVYQDMKSVGMTYVGKADLSGAFLKSNTPDEWWREFADMELPYREVLRDFYLNTCFREDIYIKGGIPFHFEEDKKQFYSDISFVQIKELDMEEEVSYSGLCFKFGEAYQNVMQMVKAGKTLLEMEEEEEFILIPISRLLALRYIAIATGQNNGSLFRLSKVMKERGLKKGLLTSCGYAYTIDERLMKTGGSLSWKTAEEIEKESKEEINTPPLPLLSLLETETEH